ncbi:MAG: Hsp20/alpha crystallin family protein [Desulfovibrionaceae bacterium]|nr:Hsp20/alpha crystallin family protein [Desulfovibrionaceae bacterium]
MNATKLNPWNWFKKEDEQEKTLPVERTERDGASPLDRFHAEFDRLVGSMFPEFGLARPGGTPKKGDGPFMQAAFKPRVDVYGTEDEYVVEAELPGMEEKDLTLEIRDDVLILSAEKERETKTEDKGYYRLERSYGSFRRVLNIPEDADREKIAAKLDKGVLRITMPRTGTVEPAARRIEIKGSAPK